MNELNEMQTRLARQRHLNTAPREDREVPTRRLAYTPIEVRLFDDGTVLERSTLDHWPETSLDNLSTFKEDSAGRRDVGYGWGVNPDPRKYRVRSLHRPSLGAVIELDSISFWLVKRECTTPGRVPRYEPVDLSTPLCGPLYPASMPSSHLKARQIAARGLRKPETELTFEMVLGWFKSKTSAKPIFKL